VFRSLEVRVSADQVLKLKPILGIFYRYLTFLAKPVFTFP
jgi:hypothetical protein